MEDYPERGLADKPARDFAGGTRKDDRKQVFGELVLHDGELVLHDAAQTC